MVSAASGALVVASGVPALKVGLTSLDLLAIVNELKLALISTRIENIYQIGDGSFLFRLHTKIGQETLIFEPGRRLNLTRFKYEIPAKPTPCASQLRHFILPSKVDSVSQVDFDRILRIDISRGKDVLRIYFELFGDGNIVVTNDAHVIKYALYYKEMKDRTIKNGLEYKNPPPRGLNLDSKESIEALHAQGFNLARSLTRLYNLPSEVVEEALARSSLDPDSKSEQASPETLKSFVESARSIVEEVGGPETKPNIVTEGGRPADVLPTEFASVAGERRYFETFNEAVDEYFSVLRVERIAQKNRSPTEASLKKFDAIMERQLLHIKELEEARREENEVGLVVISNLKAVQDAIDHVVKSRRSGVDWGLIKNSWAGDGVKIEDTSPSKGIMLLYVGGRKLHIDFKVSAADNAQHHFSASKEAARKLEGLNKALKETEEKIDLAKQGLLEAPKPVAIKAMKKDWYERFRWTQSSQGYLILGGRDATQNEVLVKKQLGTGDVFVHSDVPGGSVVIIKAGGRVIPDETKYEAATLAVVYSRAWGAGLGGADCYWVDAGQVTKTPPSGEYLGKGAFMIYGNRNYIHNVPLAIYLGIKISEQGFKIFISPTETQALKEVSHVRITPGATTGIELIKMMKEMLAQKAGEEEARIIRSIPPQELESFLPRGGCSLE